MSQLQVNRINDASGGVLAPISSVMRNRIINGAMVIDQRNAGAAVTINNANPTLYPVDRFSGSFFAASGAMTLQRNTDAPAGFVNSVVATVTTANASLGGTETVRLEQRVEGFNVADLGWGTANAKTVTLSFWAKSSLTGTFGGTVRNSGTGGNRIYIFNYSISAANTWEYKTITIAGDTSGTWLTNNGIGLIIQWSLGAGADRVGTAGSWGSTFLTGATGQTQVIGTSGATWRVTGVQFEVGTQATSFEYRQYQQELALCQRYYVKAKSDSTGYTFGPANMVSTVSARGIMQFPVVMRTSPTSLEQSGTAADYSILHTTTVSVCNSVPTFSSATLECGLINVGVASGLTAGQAGFIRAATTSGFLGFSAEL
jgi:hypothetical protein